MGLFSSIFGTSKETPLNIRKAIIAYTNGNMAELVFSNIKAFVDTYREDPTNTLKARLYSAAAMRLGINLKHHAINDIEAKFHKLDNQNSLLLFNFREYGGLFEVEPGTPMVAPSFIAIVFNNYLNSEPAIFALEPSFEVGKTMLIKYIRGGTRLNLGSGTGNDKLSFLNLVANKFSDYIDESEDTISEQPRSSLEIAEEALTEDFGLQLSDTPHPDSIEERFYAMSDGLSQNAQVSLLMRLVIMNYLAAAKIMRDEGEIVDIDHVSWLTGLVDLSVDYSEAAEDRFELESLTSQLNRNIVTRLEWFGIYIHRK